MLKQVARAKINLALHVTGVLENGFHKLDTIVTFANVGDILVIEENDQEAAFPVRLEITGPFAAQLNTPADDNLVFRAAHCLLDSARQESANLSPVKIRLEKNLPIASGIGGGSADAACALRLLAEFWQLEEKVDLFKVAATLGADVPMCLASQNLRAFDSGTEFQSITAIDPFFMVLANPGVYISTPLAFKTLAHKENPPIPFGVDERHINIDTLCELGNDLQAPAISLCPEIENVIGALKTLQGCRLARMSGSGATCFGLFDTLLAAKNAAAELAEAHPNWWVTPCYSS